MLHCFHDSQVQMSCLSQQCYPLTADAFALTRCFQHFQCH
jgi:hypothetical protein